MEKIFSKLQHLIGGLALLSLQSSVHAKYSIGFMLNRWRKPVQDGTFTYVEEMSEDGIHATPLQFMSWLFVSESWVEELRSSNSSLEYAGQPVETGPYMFILDVVSPAANPSLMIRGVIKRVRENSHQLKGIAYVRVIGEQRRVFVHDFSIVEREVFGVPELLSI